MLLRVLQEREVRPLGATAAHHVDVRVIAASNRDLEDAAFRADLHDRLNEVTVRVPPLRERAEDIPLLAEHFLALHARRHGLPRPQLTPEALAVLTQYAWPGNVRQLEQALSRAVIFGDGDRVRARDLGLEAIGEPCLSRPLDDGGDGLTRRQHEILRMAAAAGAVRRGDVTARFVLSGEAARRELLALTHRGLLRRAGRTRGSRYHPTQTESDR